MGPASCAKGPRVRDPALVLVTGATGYVGGRLVPRLLAAGHRVRVLVRDPARLEGRRWRDSTEVLQGDVLDPASLAPAMEGVDFAYYLVHTMRTGAGYYRRDLIAARNFGRAARAAGVKRIVYLGGLGRAGPSLSRHLRSRHRTGDALRASGVPVTAFRAGAIVGSGSLSFEMVRYAVERVPVILCPRWLSTLAQPIAIRNVLDYLVASLDVPESAGRILEIGGSEVLTYGDMMRGYAAVRGLERAVVAVPFLTPRLTAFWALWVTPLPADIVRPLVAGLHDEVIVRDHSARTCFPHVRPMDYRTAVARALRRVDAGEVETSWSDALFSSQADEPPVVLVTHEGLDIERRQRLVNAPPERVFEVFSSLGGDRGYPYLNLMWRLRGVVDRLVGGVGFRRGRRDPVELRQGDAVDFWRVERCEQGHLLRLRAEMKLPGRGWLEFEAKPRDDGRTQLIQTAFFASKGLSGWLYWTLLHPLHGHIFSGTIRKIAERAEAAPS